MNHFKEILSQFQAKETTQIPPHVIKAIKGRIIKERIYDNIKLYEIFIYSIEKSDLAEAFSHSKKQSRSWTMLLYIMSSTEDAERSTQMKSISPNVCGPLLFIFVRIVGKWLLTKLSDDNRTTVDENHDWHIKNEIRKCADGQIFHAYLCVHSLRSARFFQFTIPLALGQQNWIWIFFCSSNIFQVLYDFLLLFLV